ncbi:MAG: hypothetical protein DRO01_08155, partial [Thermoproteota archaeon]
MKTIHLTLLLVLFSVALFGSTRGMQIKTRTNETIMMPYENSYALLVGVSDYTNGWPDLESVPYEIEKVKVALEKQGFIVKTVIDPQGNELFDSYENFVNEYGYYKENRLLFFYAGHGFSTNGGKKGYLVPADAPNPNQDMRGFKRNAMNMGRLITLSREMESKHALFLFDSCFSGTIFKTRALPKQPPYIRKSMSKPVRQFITAGSANEEVPSSSTFTPMFINAIEGEGDLNEDGYVTGSELGIHLSQSLPNYSNQSPQYGKIKDYELSQGDFIFFLKSKFSLNVIVEPSSASIEILNIKPKFFQGMKLKKGTYRLKIKNEGYVTQVIEGEVSKDVTIEVVLTNIQVLKMKEERALEEKRALEEERLLEEERMREEKQVREEERLLAEEQALEEERTREEERLLAEEQALEEER